MNHIALLKRLLVNAESAEQRGTSGAVFPTYELRYVLESREPQSLDRLSAQISVLLDSHAYLLSPLELLDCFAVLRFPTVERTLPQRDLFGIGYALADALGLVSAEPDLGSDFYADPEPDRKAPQLESVGLSRLCQVADDPPVNRDWALANARVLQAWTLTKGKGILIAQPDTGVAAHDEIEPGMLRLDKARDFVTGGANPQDPLGYSGNPGHGTGTASVAASREVGEMAGSAPEAELIPIRCIEDVKVFNASPVVAAILHAIKVECHVITMSLGGVPSRALHSAVRKAIDNDIIVLAAAGNCVRTVVWPARYDEVIAVGGSNVSDRPWKGSCRGDAVDICAPAELVWRAQRANPADPQNIVGGGQGTSFAVALTAGVAALWLAHHGRQAAIQAARAKGLSLQALFKSALKKTARVPPGWDHDDFGAGLVDAEQLLSLQLSAISSGAVEAAPDASRSIRAMISLESGASTTAGFAWDRYGTEIAAIALAQAKQMTPLAALSVEAKTANTRPSPQLSAATSTVSDVLSIFGERPGATSVARPAMEIGFEPSSAPDLRYAVSAVGTSLERDGWNAEGVRAYLKGRGSRDQLDRLAKVLDHSELGSEERNALLSSAEEVLHHLARNEPLPRSERIVLETLVRLTGRPALRVRNGAVDIKDPRASDWHDRLFLVDQSKLLQERLKKVGRIDVDGVHVGTGFVVGRNTILTNRHVLQAFAIPIPRRTAPASWIMSSENVTIDFSDDPRSSTITTRFRIKAVIGAGPSPIADDCIEFGDLDAALLDVESMNESGSALPMPLDIPRNPTFADRHRDLLVVGYPARPAVLPRDIDGNVDTAVAARLNAIYGTDYGAKYVSPGKVIRSAEVSTDDPSGWVFDHDATTLAGNSGSAVIGLDDPMGVIGLHFGGAWLRSNFAHALGVIAEGKNVLSNSNLNWR